MKSYKKVMLWAASALLLAGCGSGSTADINIVIYEDENNHALVTSLLELYSASYREKNPLAPNLSFTLLAEQESKAVSVVNLSAPQGQAPDIFAFVHDTLSMAVTNNIISEVPYTPEIVANHTMEATSAFTFNEKLYGYPITAESQTLMYDTRKLDPSDVTSFENILAKGQKIVLDTANSDSSGYYMFSYLTDANLFGVHGTDRNQFDLNGVKGAQNLKLLTNDLRGAITSATPDASLTILSLNEAAGVISSPYLWQIFKNEIGAENAAIAVLPSVNGDTARPFSGFKGYGVNRYSRHGHIAHDVARFLSGETAQQLRFMQKGILPTIVSANLAALVANSSEASVFKASLANSLLMPNITEMGSYWAPANDAMAEIWNLRTNATTANVSDILVSATNTIKGSF